MTIKCNRFGLLSVALLFALFVYWRHRAAIDSAAVADGRASADSEHPLSAARTAERVPLTALLASALVAAQMGGREVQRLSAAAAANRLHVRTKGKTAEGADDPVTEADLRSHCAMWSRLHIDLPAAVRIVSEEAADNAKCAHLQPVEPDEAANKHDAVDVETVDVGDALHIDEWAAAGDVTVWIDPLDATQEFTGNRTRAAAVVGIIQ